MSPAALFQRIFIFVSGISISDYVRKRRLTLAGYDLKNNNSSVLNVAIKYGFQSHSSFSRAFKEHHGITPSEARLEGSYLNKLTDVKSCEDIDINDGIGLMYDFKDMHNFKIIIGDFVQAGVQIPDGLYSKLIPKGLTAQVQIEGSNMADILDSAYLLITEAIEKTGKEIDYDNFYWCEVYMHERFSEPLKRGDKVTVDYIMPIKGN
jgi:hypothetical protein